MNHGKNMKLITSFFGDFKTFKLIPLDNDCPFREIIYDPSSDLLVALSVATKEKLQLVPHLDDDGNQVPAKKPKANGKPYKERRVTLNVPNEYYLPEREEAIELIEQFAINHKEFDYEHFFKEADKARAAVYEQQKAPITDKDGKILTLDKKGKKATAAAEVVK